MTINELTEEIERIKERNRRVEREKAWETSLTRKFMIAVLTYIVIVVFFQYAGFPEPFKNALVPSLAFILSTLSIPIVKNLWLKYIHKG